MSILAGTYALRLRYVDFQRVEFALVDEEGRVERPVVVMVGSGCDWCQAVQFPSSASEGGQTTGDPALDREVCERTAEELSRLEAAHRVASSRGAV
jgi:hypothetical protein